VRFCEGQSTERCKIDWLGQQRRLGAATQRSWAVAPNVACLAAEAIIQASADDIIAEVAGARECVGRRSTRDWDPQERTLFAGAPVIAERRRGAFSFFRRYCDGALDTSGRATMIAWLASTAT
jgi:hypothetical protein